MDRTDPLDESSINLCYKYRITGEKWGFHKTDVLRQYPFPELENASFFREGIIWNRIGRAYKTRFINKVVRIYKQDAGEQLTKKTPIERSWEYIFYLIQINEDFDYFFSAPIKFFKLAIQYTRLSLHEGINLKDRLRLLRNVWAKFLLVTCLPPGILLFYHDRHTSRLSRLKENEALRQLRR